MYVSVRCVHGSGGKLTLLWTGAAIGPAGSGTSGFGSGFIQPVGEDGFGMCCGPAVGQHLLQPLVICMEAEQEVADVDPGLDAMTLGTGEDRG